jgi:hypothetical protein
MNRPEEDSILEFFQNVPPLNIQDRIYVGSNGHLVLDSIHGYTGGLGRYVLNTIVGGYSRSDILETLENRFTQLTLLSTRCVAKLNNPYIRGNRKMFNIRTLETKYYEHCVSCITHNLADVQAVLNTQLIIYQTDVSTCVRLRALLNTSNEIHCLLRPLLTHIR